VSRKKKGKNPITQKIQEAHANQNSKNERARGGEKSQAVSRPFHRLNIRKSRKKRGEIGGNQRPRFVHRGKRQTGGGISLKSEGGEEGKSVKMTLKDAFNQKGMKQQRRRKKKKGQPPKRFERKRASKRPAGSLNDQSRNTEKKKQLHLRQSLYTAARRMINERIRKAREPLSQEAKKASGKFKKISQREKSRKIKKNCLNNPIKESKEWGGSAGRLASGPLDK